MQRVVYVNLREPYRDDYVYNALSELNQALAAGWKVVSCSPVSQHVSSSSYSGSVGAFFVLEKEDK